MSSQIELIVRGVQILSGEVLVVKQVDASHAFLPGGHVAFLESAEKALAREIREELGRDVSIKSFIGMIEHTYLSGTSRKHELNILFAVEIEGVVPGEDPVSLENHLTFFWQPIDRLSEVNVQPHFLQTLLPSLPENPIWAVWASSLG